MNANAERIAELLHRTRSPGWTSDDTLELSGSLKTATSHDCHWALLTFASSLLAAAHGVVQIQRDAALVEQIMNERDEAGGQLQ